MIAFLSETIKNDQNQSLMILEVRADLAPERRERMRILIRKAGVARVEDLKSDLKVSVATVRRDLEALEEEADKRKGGIVQGSVEALGRISSGRKRFTVMSLIVATILEALGTCIFASRKRLFYSSFLSIVEVAVCVVVHVTMWKSAIAI